MLNVFAGVLLIVALGVSSVLADETRPASDRQSIEDAWWTGPLLAASPATLPPGRVLFEPYVFDVYSDARFDANGRKRSAPDAHYYGSQSYLLYGLAERVTVGLIPRFGFNELGAGGESSRVRVGDLTLQGQYRFTQFKEGAWIPTISFVVQETLPIGRYDELGDRPADGVGSGAFATTLAVYAQSYYWMPNGRLLRARINLAYTFADEAELDDVSVYGTSEGFQGEAQPGEAWLIDVAGEYSLTQNWVLALDLVYEREGSTRVAGIDRTDQSAVAFESGSRRRFGVAPAVEYNFNAQVGVIFGVRWYVDGRNAAASITPAVAINMVY